MNIMKLVEIINFEIAILLKNFLIMSSFYLIFRKRKIKNIIYFFNDTREKLAIKGVEILKYKKENSFIGRGILNMQIKYVEQTNIKKILPFINIKNFIFIIFILVSISFIFSFYITGSFIISLFLGCFFSTLPFMILDFIRYNNYQKIRGDISNMLSILNHWYSIKEDILMSFEKTASSDIGEPLKSYLKDFVVQISRGLDISEGFYILEKKIDSPFFRNFIINLDQAVKNRGNIRILLSNLEKESYKLEQEYNRRKIKTSNERIIIYIVMVSVFLVGYNIVLFNPVTRTFYLNTITGNLLILIYCIVYLLGFLISMGITKLYY